METRKITVLDTATNTKKEIYTSAETFGQLKEAVIAAGIDIVGKDWLEGISGSIPANDNSILPTNLVVQSGAHKGQVTNDLVYCLTNTEKRIKSGIDRAEILIAIRDNNLQSVVKEHYGRPYTNVPTTELIKVLEKNTKSEQEIVPCTCTSVVEAIANMIVSLGTETTNAVLEKVVELRNAPKSVTFSEDELNEMFNI